MNFLANLFGNNNQRGRDRPRRSAPTSQRSRDNQSNARSRSAASQQQQSTQQRPPPTPTPPPQEAPPDFTSFQIPAGMEHIISQILAQTGMMPEEFQAQFTQQMQEQQSPNAPPPASDGALRTLPIVTVTPEDLVDENNRECVVCFEPHNLGDKVVRLPCAHICKFFVFCVLCFVMIREVVKQYIKIDTSD